MNYLSLMDTLGAIKKSVGEASGNIRNASIVSLPQFIKPSLIESPNFMQTSLAEEPIVNDILKNMYNIYIGYILCALQMNDIVVGDRRVRDLLSAISSTEAFIDTSALVQGLTGTVETFDPKSIVKRPGESEADYNRRVWEAQQRYELDKSKLPNISGSGHSADKTINVPIASGRQVEVTFSAGPDREPIKVLINVKFNTRLIPNEVVEHIVSQDVTASVYQRWLQFRAGEIRFLKDFVFRVDQLQRKEDALRSDKTHVLSDIFYQQSNVLRQQIRRLFGHGGSSYNLANSILMLDEETATYYARKSNFSFEKYADRKRFFSRTYNLFIILVDNRFSRVTIYTNGLEQGASYSFNEMKASGSSDKMSLKDIMEYLSKNQMPKF